MKYCCDKRKELEKSGNFDNNKITHCPYCGFTDKLAPDCLVEFFNDVNEELRKRKITMFNFSKSLGMGTSWYGTLKWRKRNITVSNLRKIAKGLDMKLVVCLVEKD